MMSRLSALSVVAVLLFAVSSVNAYADSIEIDEPWARPNPPGAPSAGFMIVKNTGSDDDVLLGVSGDFAAKLEVHRSSMVDSVMKMEHQKDGVVIPAGEQVVFKPGSYHLMFMGLKKNFEPGEVYTVTLTFKQAGIVQVELPVKAMP